MDIMLNIYEVIPQAFNHISVFLLLLKTPSQIKANKFFSEPCDTTNLIHICRTSCHENSGNYFIFTAEIIDLRSKFPHFDELCSCRRVNTLRAASTGWN